MPNITFVNDEGETLVLPSMKYAPASYPHTDEEDNRPFTTYHSRRRKQQMRKKRNSRRNRN